MRLDRHTHQVQGFTLASWRRRGPGPRSSAFTGGVSSRELLPFVEAMGQTHDTWAGDEAR